MKSSRSAGKGAASAPLSARPPQRANDKEKATAGTTAKDNVNFNMANVPVVTKGSKGGLLTAQEIPDEILDLTNKPHTKYTRGRFLGKGGFAKCYEVTTDKSSGVLACKIVNKNMLVKAHHRDKMAQEIKIHRTLQHPNIVAFHSFFEDDLFVYIVLECCEKKSLLELSKRRKTITEPEARYFLQQICEAVRYLHEDKGVIHRDLKLGNIFISDMKVKVGDFGLASYYQVDGNRKRTLCGTPNYIAPEVLTKAGHGFEVDIWSIGCVLYTLLLGKPPFETDSIRETYRRIKEGDFRFPSNRLCVESRNLIKRMLQVDPYKRPSARQILKDDYLRKGFIPDVLPVTALTMAPRFPNASAPRMPLQEVPVQLVRSNGNGNTVKSGAFGAAGVLNPYGQPAMEGSFNNNDDSDNNGNPPIVELMESLRAQLQNAVEAANCHRKPLPTDDENEDPSLAPMLFILRWVDYSDKYGFGYQLSDDSIGVSFNDLSKVILYPDGNMTFINKFGEELHCELEKYPTSYDKKVRLVKHFQQYMAQYLLRPRGPPMINFTCAPQVPSLYTWFRTSKSVVMCLANGTVQINNFRSHRKMILCPIMGAITVIEQSQPMRTYKLSNILNNGCTEAMKEDLLYSLGKIETICSAAARAAVGDPIVQDPPAAKKHPVAETAHVDTARSVKQL